MKPSDKRMKITRPEHMRPTPMYTNRHEVRERRPRSRSDTVSLVWTSATPMTEEEIAARLHGQQFEDDPRALRTRALFRFQPR